MSTELSIPEKMNLIVNDVLTNDKLEGFQKAYVVSESIVKLRELLTPEYMKPIMALMNTRLGFKTDKPNTSPYSIDQVKECLIEAVFLGLQPYGNEFNIIAGNCYPTKEGMGALLSRIKGLNYKIVPELPRMNSESAAVKMLVTWTFNGVENKEAIEIPIKVNRMMGTDAVIGKATRKARAWLYGVVTGQEVVDGDVMDADFRDITPKKRSVQETQDEQHKEELRYYLQEAKNINDLSPLEEACKESGLDLEFNARKTELQNG